MGPWEFPSCSHLYSILQQGRLDNTVSCEASHYHLDVAEFDKSVVTALLEFIYTGELIALTSSNCGIRDDLAELCTKFGITVNGISADNSFATDLPE